VVILALVQAAVVAGATSFAAIRHWIGAAPQQVLADIGARQSRWTGEYQAPHPDPVCRVLQRVDPAEVDAAYARYRAAQLPDLYDTQAATGDRAGGGGDCASGGELVPVSVDGKSQRGTADGEQTARHRLGVMLADDGITLAQVDVDGKSNEITAFVPLLDRLPDLTNMVISADMMHTQRARPLPASSRRLLRAARRREPAGPVRPARRPALGRGADRVDDLRPWSRPSGDPYHPGPPCPQTDQVPHVKQVFLVERHFYDLHWKPLSCQAVLGVTSLPAHRADPQQLAALVRGEWSIENCDHYVRDVTLGEDRCRVRTGALPSILAVMRSHTVGALRLLGFTNIAEGTRWARDDFARPLILLGLT
jgi:predicted transposase YbfD/YdcC